MAQMEMAPVKEVMKELGMQHRQVVKAILNGTLPIGTAVAPENENEHYKVRIPRIRWEKWKRGEL